MQYQKLRCAGLIPDCCDCTDAACVTVSLLPRQSCMWRCVCSGLLGSMHHVSMAFNSTTLRSCWRLCLMAFMKTSTGDDSNCSCTERPRLGHYHYRHYNALTWIHVAPICLYVLCLSRGPICTWCQIWCVESNLVWDGWAVSSRPAGGCIFIQQGRAQSGASWTASIQSQFTVRETEAALGYEICNGGWWSIAVML